MDPKSVKQETSRQWSEGLTAAARTTQLIRGGSPESLSRSPVSPSAEPLAAPPPRSEMASIGAGARGTGRSREKQPADESRRLPRDSNAESDDIVVAGENAEPSSAERDAEHFKMVATRFRALMERRERRLEEAMSDPQTRSDLEAMFPGMKQGDYQTLLAGVRGMEEDDFQALLAGARKRRQEVSVGSFGASFCITYAEIVSRKCVPSLCGGSICGQCDSSLPLFVASIQVPLRGFNLKTIGRCTNFYL